MIVIENDCVDCELPCIYRACPYYEVTRYYCDNCGEEYDLYYYDGEQLCVDCILERLEKVDIDET